MLLLLLQYDAAGCVDSSRMPVLAVDGCGMILRFSETMSMMSSTRLCVVASCGEGADVAYIWLYRVKTGLKLLLMYEQHFFTVYK